MARLEADFTPAFSRDLKRLSRKYVDDQPLSEVIELILENSTASLEELRRRHRMHTLKGAWQRSFECHVANAGDWLLIWTSSETLAVFQRTGTHDELFR